MPKKFVVALNKSIEPARLMNAIGHLSIGLGAEIQDKQHLGLITYVDKDGNQYPNISEYGYIALKTSGGKLKTFHETLKQTGIQHSVFLDTMIEGTSDEQVARTKEKSYDELNYFAVVAFGEKTQLDPLTSKFSLYR